MIPLGIVFHGTTRPEPIGSYRRPTKLMTMRRNLVLPASAVLALAVAACGAGSPPPTATPSPTPTPTATPVGVILTVETRGGRCVDGPCGETFFVERDGLVHQAAKQPNEIGIVPPAELAALDEAIRTTDFAALKSHRFTGTCPTAYDGQELVFEFHAPGGVERIESCRVNVDFGEPLFVAVANAVGPFIALPTTND
jgi:hypothetical protein